jgi:hypothetical protein
LGRLVARSARPPRRWAWRLLIANILQQRPPATADAVRDGASTGVQVAQQLGSPELLDSVRSAFVHGLDVMLVSASGIALVGLVLGVLFLPNRPDRPDEVERADQVGQPTGSDGESEHDVVRT